MSASSQQALDSIMWDPYPRTEFMVRCLDFPGRKPIYGDRPFWKVSVHVDVTVFVKPHTLQFGQFSVETRSLNVEIAKGLHFETYHRCSSPLKAQSYALKRASTLLRTISSSEVSMAPSPATGRFPAPCRFVRATGVASTGRSTST